MCITEAVSSKSEDVKDKKKKMLGGNESTTLHFICFRREVKGPAGVMTFEPSVSAECVG